MKSLAAKCKYAIDKNQKTIKYLYLGQPFFILVSKKNDLDSVLKGDSTTKKEERKEGDKNQKTTEVIVEKDNTSKYLMYGGVLLLVALVGFLAYKKMKKS